MQPVMQYLMHWLPAVWLTHTNPGVGMRVKTDWVMKHTVGAAA